MCKVTGKAEGKITNIADITKYKDENKKEVDISAGVITVKVQDPKTGEIEKQIILHETNGKYTRVYETMKKLKVMKRTH